MTTLTLNQKNFGTHMAKLYRRVVRDHAITLVISDDTDDVCTETDQRAYTRAMRDRAAGKTVSMPECQTFEDFHQFLRQHAKV